MREKGKQVVLKDGAEGWEDRLVPRAVLTRRDFLKVAGGATIAIPLGVAACGTGVAPTTAPEGSPVPSATAAEAATAVATAAPASGGTGVLIYGTTQLGGSIDPAVGYDLWARYIDDNCYDSLFRFEDVPPRLVNHLAKSYEVSDDGLEWMFYLEEGVTFHDGSPLTAHDVKYTVERMLALQDAPSFLWETVDPDQLEVIDDHTVKIGLKEVFGPFLYTLPWLYIVNEKLLGDNEQGEDWGKDYLLTHEAGSGPWMITKFDRDVAIDLGYFPEYWQGWSEKHLDGWIFEVHRETSTLKQLLRSGEVHMSDRLSLDDYDVVDQYPDVDVVEDVTMSPFMLKMNCQKEPTSNRDFRKALTYALDYSAIVDGVFGGHASYAKGPLPPTFPGHVSFDYGRDLDLARDYLDKSGYDPAELELTYMWVSGDPRQRDEGLALANSLKDLGIKMVLEEVTWPVFVERCMYIDTTTHVAPIWAAPDYPDAEILFYPQYHSHPDGTGSWYSLTWYNNPEFDRLIEQARRTFKEEERIPIYEELQQILWDDAPDMWVYVKHWRQAVNNRVKGYKFQPAGMLSTDFRPMYLEES